MKMHFGLTMILTSIMLVSSSSNWLTIWISLEMGTMGFIMSFLDKAKSESLVMYLIVQAVASTVILIQMTMSNQLNISKICESNTSNMMMVMALMTKMGIIPVHQWMVAMAKQMSWASLTVLMTIQKVAPLILMAMIKMKYFILIIATMGIITSTTMLFKTLSTKMIMLFSSLTHSSWLYMLMTMSQISGIVYMMIYFPIIMVLFKSISKANLSIMSNKSNFKTSNTMILSALSLAGVPPLVGFMLKWISVETMMKNKISLMLTISLIAASIPATFIYCHLFSNQALTKPLNSKIKTKQEKKAYSSFYQTAPIPMLILSNK